jgi:uracil-DNA glycosylase
MDLNYLYAHPDVYPPKDVVYRAIELCPLYAAKVVILGQDPYHTEGAANGLAFSVNKGYPIPPSLRNIYKELVSDIGCAMPTHGDLTKWVEQGVLLLNPILTVEKGKPMSHADIGWESVTDKLISDCSIIHKTQPIVFLLWGNKAKKKKELIDYHTHAVLTSTHPSPFSANKGFLGSKPFSRTNKYLELFGHKPIDWSIE